jgi:hypothetical protein
LAPHNFCVSPIERLPFWHNCGDRSRIAGGAEHPHRIWLPGVIYKMIEALETVHMLGRGLL